MANITITHPDINSGNPVRVLATTVTLSAKKNNVQTPDNTYDGVKVLTKSVENPSYTISGVKIDEGVSGTLTFAHLRTLYKTKYDDTNAIVLNVEYDTSTNLGNIVGTSSNNIRCVLASYNFVLDSTQSRDAYIPRGTIVLTETL